MALKDVFLLLPRPMLTVSFLAKRALQMRINGGLFFWVDPMFNMGIFLKGDKKVKDLEMKICNAR